MTIVVLLYTERGCTGAAVFAEPVGESGNGEPVITHHPIWR
jgi:hypothetical protein